MNCWHCGGEVIWGGDFDYEDYGMDGEGIVSNLSCSKCKAFFGPKGFDIDYYSQYLCANYNDKFYKKK